MLIEFVLLTLIYYYAFGWKVITASTASYKTPSGENLDDTQVYLFNSATSTGSNSNFDTNANNTSSGNGGSSGAGGKFSFCTFLCDVLRFTDVVGVLTYKGELYSAIGTEEEDTHDIA